MIVVGVDPGLTGAISIRDGSGLLQIHDMPQQVKSVKRKRNRQGVMQDYPKYEVSAAGVAKILHPSNLGLHANFDVKIYIEQVGAVYRQDKQKAASQPLAATFQFGEGFGVLRGICEAYYGPENVIRVPPVKWKKHFGLLKTEKDAARLYAIDNISLPDVPELLKRKKDGGRADALLICTYGLDQELMRSQSC